MTRTGFLARVRAFWLRHRSLFWILHSVWALATGIVVIVLAHERYGFVPWVAAFLVLTWASTMFFGRRLAGEAAPAQPVGPPAVPGLLDEFASYLTRIMYQETLFFLLPFYAYSTVLGSLNLVFLVLLGGLAVVSCLDLVFDRWLRSSPVFGLVFFATVAFSALNLVLPLLFGLSPQWSAPLAGTLAVASAVPLALRSLGRDFGAALRVGGAALLVLLLAVGFPRLVPPVPLRLQETLFGPEIDRGTLALSDTLVGSVPLSSLPDGLVVVARVFAPLEVPTRVTVEWKREGRTVRVSREIELTAHQVGFRVWDALRPASGAFGPGRYQVILRTHGHRVFGKAEVEVVEG